jgi:hypothetical protein
MRSLFHPEMLRPRHATQYSLLRLEAGVASLEAASLQIGKQTPQAGDWSGFEKVHRKPLSGRSGTAPVSGFQLQAVRRINIGRGGFLETDAR